MITLLYFIVAIGYNLLLEGVMTEQQTFLFYTILNIVIFAHFTFYVYKRSGTLGLLHPTVLASLYFFALCFGITNFPFMSFSEEGGPPSNLLADSFGNSFLDVNGIMFWSIISHLCMWIGSQFLGVQEASTKALRRFPIFNELPSRNEVKIKLMIGLYVSTVLIKVIMIFLGVYGFTQNHANVVKYKGILGSLKIITALGQVCVFLIAIHFFRIKKHTTILFCIGILEVFFGLLAGFKSQLFMPFLIFAFSYFYVNRKINYLYLVAFFISLNIAYATVEPFRKQFAQQEKDDYTITDILNTYISAQENKKELTSNDRNVPTWVQASDRLNLTYTAALSYRYFLKNGAIDEFRIPERLYMLPFITFVPKSIWPNKPDATLGNIAYKKIMGGDSDNTCIDLSSIAFTFLGWGAFWVIIPVFILYGVIQSFYSVFLYRYGLAGLIIYLSNLLALYAMFELSFFLVAAIRGLIIGFIVQHFLLARSKRKAWPVLTPVSTLNP